MKHPVIGNMIYGSVCSGIEAATVAWRPLGWRAAFFSEIEKFPRAVLSHHYPNTPLHGDFTTIGDEYGPIDLLVGGTPCQSFSLAGLRKGMDDDRGNLALEYLKLAQRLRPKWVVWENVPGVLSSNGGKDFFSFIGGLQKLGYGFAYRVLDAQYFGVPQRRRRVFVVGCLGDWRSAAAVLFERHSMQGHPAPVRAKKQDVAGTITASAGSRRGCGIDPGGIVVSQTGHRMLSLGKYIPDETASTLAARDYKSATDLIAFSCKDNGRDASIEVSPTLRAMSGKKLNGGGQIAVVASFKAGQGAKAGGIGYQEECAPTLTSGNSGSQQSPGLLHHRSVRRLTPIECERLQGFPDHYTQIPWRSKSAENCPDSPRYKAIGNSMAVPVMRWIGERIEQVSKIDTKEVAT